MSALRRFVPFLALALMSQAASFAADHADYDQKAFEAAQASNFPILLDVSAPWCPTCRAQKPILEKLTADPAYKDLKIFEIDFDSQTALLRSLRVQKQSTLIVYKGKVEQGRSTGDTAEASIGALLHKSL
jgi:thiol-disulfide isomerase/thioredoxin